VLSCCCFIAKRSCTEVFITQLIHNLCLGEEILELLRRNPAGTIPVLLKRLKQKDLEWRRARAELNKVGACLALHVSFCAVMWYYTGPPSRHKKSSRVSR
jgi:hypothetical protein